MIFGDGNDEEVDPEVNQQENHHECPRERHDKLFGQRGKS
jgi:hypothetical protein